MTDPDPLCPNPYADDCDYCALIAKVRADDAIGDLLMRQSLADLRAKVKALLNADTFGTSYDEAIGDVLALIDGSSDD